MQAAPLTALNLGWLTGSWVGTIGDDRIEIHWSTPDGDTLMGMFRWMKDDAVYMYEFITIESESGTGQLVMRIKHFNEGLVAWEDQREATVFLLETADTLNVSFRIQNSENFTRMIFELVNDGNTLRHLMQMDPQGHREMEFVYQRLEVPLA